MATPAATVLRRPRALAMSRANLAAPLGLGLLAALSVLVRTTQIGAGLWVDEGLSYGIADRPLTDIPGVMRQDGSPPLYYMLLHVWTRALDVRAEAALHALSLLFAILVIPMTWVLVRELLSVRAAWIGAVLIASNPFLSQYAQEARMYSLVVALSVAACATFAGAFALGRGRRWTVAYALVQTTLLYTHNWGLFLGAGLAAAWALLVATAEPHERRALVREGVLAAAIILVLYAAWLPTLAFQAAHTGAPWANPPSFSDLYEAPQKLLGLTGQYLLLTAGGLGLATIARGPVRRWPAEARAALALGVAALVALLIPWTLSQASPAWALRYLAIGVGPLVLLATIGLARAGRLGLVAMALTALVWAAFNVPATKSNVRSVAETVSPSLSEGDLVISTQPEQIPVLHYYLHNVPGLQWATITGPLSDLGVTDWRDGIDRLRATSVARDLEPLLNATRPGQRVLLVSPDFSIGARWKAPWSDLVRNRSLAWQDAVQSDPRFRAVAVEPPNPVARSNEVTATVYVRQPLESRPSSRAAGAQGALSSSGSP